ncbi:Resolvase [Parelusimicrobium proximum]|uniref:recombinase family protein n=1 Tax=Parelusimicrobium proximum TaxID=3228953 RepID=UPI003D164B49
MTHKTGSNNTAVIYCRTATEEQSGCASSLAAQEEACMDYAKTKGLTVVDKFIECASGRTINRSQLQKMLALCSSNDNNISAVICLGECQLGRDFANNVFIKDTLSKNNVELLFVKGGNYKDISGHLTKYLRG